MSRASVVRIIVFFANASKHGRYLNERSGASVETMRKARERRPTDIVYLPHCLNFCSFAYGFTWRRKHVRYKSTPGGYVEIFGSFCVIFKEKLSFKNCKISGWQKC